MAGLRTPITLAVLVVLVVGGALVGWGLATQSVPSLSGSDDKVPCKTVRLRPGAVLRISQVTVNVYNAGTVAGLAEDTQAALVDSGMRPGTTGNAPAEIESKRTLVLDPQPRSAAVQLVKAQFKTPVRVRKVGDDLARGVDVVVGDRTPKLRASGRSKITVDVTTEVCVPRASLQ
jgi:hypothetical protein